MFAKVILAKRGKITLPFFDYSVPLELEGKIIPGQLVKVPFRNRAEFGVIESLTDSSAAPAKLIRPITEIVVQHPLLQRASLDFLLEISELYHTSLGSLIKTTLPPLQKRKLTKLPNFESTKTPKAKAQKPAYFIYDNDEQKRNYLLLNIATEGQTLLIVPEVADVEAALTLLGERPDVCAITSYLSEKDLFSTWVAIWSGEKKVIVGTRLALFMSFHDLATIILDNDSHPSHKSWDMAPRFHARDAALIASKHYGAKLHLTSHLPSVESWFFAKEKIYEAVGERLLPELGRSPELINLKGESRGGNYGPLGFDLQEAITETRQGGIFLYCNRRGNMAYSQCRDCSTVLTCKNCQRALVHHERPPRLVCHHCRREEPLAPACASCGGVNFARYGVGVEAVADELARLFPDDQREIITIEGDEKSLNKIKPGEDQIIVGTQLAFPYVDWKNLGLMAFIDADTPLFIPEFKTTEHVLQTLGMAGYRLPDKARWFVQTNRPDHYVFAALTDYSTFYKAELSNRRMFEYPPYRFMLKLFYGAPEKAETTKEADRLYRELERLTKQLPEIKITPPLELFPPFLKGNHWQALILKLPYKNYKQLIRAILKVVPETWKVDPNPNNLLSI